MEKIKSLTLVACALLYFGTCTKVNTQWVSQNSGTSSQLLSVYFVNQTTGFSCGLNGKVLKTTNGGTNWLANTVFDTSVAFMSMHFINPLTGFIVGRIIVYDSIFIAKPIIVKTTNEGVTWNSVLNDSFYLLNSVYFLNENTGFAVGQSEYWPPHIFSARIIKTTNSGDNWYIDTVFSNLGGLASIYFIDQNTGYAVGSSGTILKTTTGGNIIGIEPISKEIPVSFSLSQNHPNPFNPSTKIKFDIPPDSRLRGNDNVMLKIYDVLGREITTLVNERLKPGTYEVEWDGSNYSSGVYFYKLITADYSETKKMILIK